MLAECCQMQSDISKLTVALAFLQAFVSKRSVKHAPQPAIQIVWATGSKGAAR